MKKCDINFTDSDRIAHTLMLESFFEPEMGLFKGQMGIVLTLSEYSRRKENEIYSDFSFDLLENVIAKVNKGLPFSLSNGLAGIGWGIEYLIQNKFVEGSGVEICEEIDQKIMETDPKRIWDLSLENGFEGLLHYVIYHVKGALDQNTGLPFDDRYLSDIYAMCSLLKERIKDTSISILLDVFRNFYNTGNIKDYNTSVIDFVIMESTDISNEISSYPLGLKDGLAGKLLKIIFAK
ncbi:MAG: hypothetical protein PHS04_05865 [Tissierellia bacterium]|jgi:hypothetical protein|nr:hypothetical protein [Tissierellia bacterium]